MSTSTRTTPTPIPTTRASSAELSRCLDPVGVEQFLAEYWERKPLALRRGMPGRFDDLLSERDVERVVTSGGLRHPAFRLVKAGAQLDVADYTVDVSWRPVPFAETADVERVAAEFDAGATIVLQALHLHWPPLGRFCRGLEQELGQPAQANAYYTPRHSQGLGVHHDTHDVFVLQVAGEKRWLVYEPVLELPLRGQRYRPDLGGPGKTFDDLVLGPGDTLYLPRGWLHEALTSDSDSLHLTIGINVYPWIEAVRAALDECADELAFRRSVPRDGQPDDDLLALLADRLEPAKVAERARERFLRTRRPIRHGLLSELRALDSLGQATEVERRDTVIADLGVSDGHVLLAYEGKRLSFPDFVREDLEFLLAADGPVRPADLPGDLGEESRLVLLRRLVREGFLRLSALDPE
jgi:ribosomal protein L16 Arg81 hydroxylase